MTQNILVTGGSGFIGSHLVDQLARLGHRVVVLDVYPRSYDDLPSNVSFVQGSLHDITVVRRALEDHQIGLVYHAAWSGIHETALKDMVGHIQTNLVASINLLNACHEVGVRRVVFLSSGGTVYGVPKQLPISEVSPTDPINAYGIAKLMVEKYLHMFYHLYHLEYIILRPSVPYGPRQNPLHHQGAISVFLYNALVQKAVTIFGDGTIVRDYFYIEDLVGALIASKDIAFDPSVTTFNIGGGQPYTLNDLVMKIESVLGMKIFVNYESARIFDAPNILLDTSLAKKYLNWEPSVPLEEGIQRTADWLRKFVIS